MSSRTVREVACEDAPRRAKQNALPRLETLFPAMQESLLRSPPPRVRKGVVRAALALLSAVVTDALGAKDAGDLFFPGEEFVGV